ESANLSKESGDLAWEASAFYFLGSVYLDIGEYVTSQRFCEKAISVWQNTGMASCYIMWNIIPLALAKVMNNEKDVNLNEILKWHEEIKHRWIKGLVLNCIGKIMLNIDVQHISEAEDWIKRAIEINEKYGMKWSLARSFVLYAELFKRKGDLPKAKEKLNTAIEIFKECGADGWVEKYEKELAAFL
ncbi:MAG: tetratricopeptide repeat protein, partial [Desulfobacterales bacterium]